MSEIRSITFVSVSDPVEITGELISGLYGGTSGLRFHFRSEGRLATLGVGDTATEARALMRGADGEPEDHPFVRSHAVSHDMAPGGAGRISQWQALALLMNMFDEMEEEGGEVGGDI